MSFLLWQRDGGFGIAARRRVLRAAEVPLLEDAQALCDRLEALRIAEAARIEAACAEGRRDGYATGHREGAQAAADEHAARLTALAVAAAAHREALAAQVAALALEVARKLVGSLADEERLVALARTAAADLTDAAPMMLRVHPARADAVRDRLAALAADERGQPSVTFEVRADAGCAIDSCRLDTGLGSVDASVDTQLERLAAAWAVTAATEEA